MYVENLKEALTHPSLSLPLAGRFMAILRPAMQEAGLTDFPVITLTGEPGSGKTSIIRAVADKSCAFLSFQQPNKEVLALLKEQKSKFAIVDDFATLGADTGRRGQLNLLDKVVRQSYCGELGQISVTIEKAALSQVTESCRQRMLIVDVGEGIADTQCSDLVYALAESNDLELVLEAFKNFARDRFVPFDCNLKRFRQGLRQFDVYDSRTASLVYVYAETMALINEFFINEGLGELSETARNAIVTNLLLQREKAPVPLEEIILKKLLASNVLSVQHCFVRDECTIFCSKGCAQRSHWCEESCSLFDIEPKRVATYAPTDIFLDYSGGYNALLIDEPNMVPLFRRDNVPPFLIMNEATLTALMNAALKDYCMEHHLRATYFTGPTLRKKLSELNRCMVRLNEEKGYRYTFPQPIITEVGVSQTQAVAIFLLPKEVSTLKSTPQGQLLHHQKRLEYAQEAPKVINALSKTWVHFTAGVTPVGMHFPEHC